MESNGDGHAIVFVFCHRPCYVNYPFYIIIEALFGWKVMRGKGITGRKKKSIFLCSRVFVFGWE